MENTGLQKEPLIPSTKKNTDDAETTKTGNMGYWKDYKLLLWKIFILQKRRPISTIFELFLPVFFVVILLALRIFDVKQTMHKKYIWSDFKVSNNIPDTISKTHHGKWKLAFTPNTSYYHKLMSNVPTYLNVGVNGFKNERHLIDAVVTDEEGVFEHQLYLCGIVFDSKPNDGKIKYRLRFPASPRGDVRQFSFFPKKWYTQFVYPFKMEGFGPRRNGSKYGGRPSYYEEGFLSVQRAVDFSILYTKNSSFNASHIDINMRRFPYPRRIVDKFLIIIQTMLPMIIMASFVYTAKLIVTNIVYEKENKLKESMIMMGLKGWIHWLAWFTKCFVFLTFSMIMITIMLCARFGKNSGKMLESSDPSLIFVFLMMYSISAIMFCFFISTFFYRASLSAAGAGIIWFLSYSPYFILFNNISEMTKTTSILACMDFNVAMALAANLIGRFEGQGSGVQWSNVLKGVTVDDKFLFGHVLLMFVIDSIFYGILTWYIDGIFPGEFGVPKKWYFPFTKKYWCGIQQQDSGTNGYSNEGAEQCMENDSEFIEKEPESLKPGIKIMNLLKQFKTDAGTKIAVNKVNLNMYEGQITALLGHNGAGKTTTISMLTGLFPPTSGNAIVNGYDILHNIEGVQRSLGICPQHNILFDLMTVEEHLYFFTKLKGTITDKMLVKEEVNRMIKLIGLEEKCNVQAQYLSGGMKRKLSVGIALVGGSKIVMLDEPTSGMDVSARRFTWELLQKERDGRTILLTTHFMDEADVLGDRIAIMADGQIKCCGSSLFLKNKYGVGYHMVMVKDIHCNVDTITHLIKSYVPIAQLESNIGMELSYILPSEYSYKFEGLFSEIESRRDELGVSSYGASVTTLEEVFFKVAESSGSNENIDDSGSSSLWNRTGDQLCQENPSANVCSDGYFSDGSYIKNKGIKLIFQRWYAMFVKKMIFSKRHKVSIISQFIMPSIFVMTAMVSIKTMPKNVDSPPRLLTLDMFDKNDVAFESRGNSSFIRKLSASYTYQVKGTSTIVRLKSHVNMTEYFLHQENIDLPKFNLDHVVAMSLSENDKNSNKVSSTAWFNNEAIHTAPVSLNMLMNALLMMYTTNSSQQIIVTNDPLPVTTQQGLTDITMNPVGFKVGFALSFGMAFLASSFIVFLVQERASKAKHLQFVSGVDPFSYWTSSYLWDLINFVLPCVSVLIILSIFAEDCFSGERLGYVMLLLILFGWAIIPFMYMFSFAFQIASTAFTRMTILNILSSMTMMIIVSILQIPKLGLLQVAKALKWSFVIFPNFCLCQGIVDMFNNFQSLKIFDHAVDMCVDLHPTYSRATCKAIVKDIFDTRFKQMEFQNNYLSWHDPGIGRYLVFLSAEGILYFAIVFLIEYEVFHKLRRICSRKKPPLEADECTGYDNSEGVVDDVPPIKYSTNKVSSVRGGHNVLDDDVIREKERIMHSDHRANHVLIFRELTKTYKSGTANQLVAVNKLTLGIPHGECFGLLGQNGAGKTTTFKMLTGDEKITSGSADVDGFDVNSNLSQARQRVGYCPQFDALIDLMTGRELLTMFARLRGVPEMEIPRMIDSLAKCLTFDKYLNKVTKTYSGGNKRKLSTAIALVGDPPLVFLDEPSAGMDPVARRMLWDSLSKLITSGKSIVITSHSMEECEALCTRLAIMVNGQFKCLGSPQHLKTKFGEGYTLIARVGGIDPDTDPLREFIDQMFPGSILKDIHEGYVHYQLKTEKHWAYLFGIMEEIKTKFLIEDYSVSQTTLEQIFLNFTRTQRNVEE